ncbi:MAG TPA: cobalamin biosynthesis protein, partial [Methanobacterium sp.]
TAEPKKDESGILETAEKLGVELEVVSLDQLKKFDHPEVSESPFVMKTFGVPGICEPVALYVAGEQACLIYGKTSFNKVTVAVAVSSWLVK